MLGLLSQKTSVTEIHRHKKEKLTRYKVKFPHESQKSVVFSERHEK